MVATPGAVPLPYLVPEVYMTHTAPKSQYFFKSPIFYKANAQVYHYQVGRYSFPVPGVTYCKLQATKNLPASLLLVVSCQQCRASIIRMTDRSRLKSEAAVWFREGMLESRHHS